MANSKSKNRGNYRNYRESSKRDCSKKKKQKQAISGFSTLNQVAGVPLIREHHSNIPILPTKSVAEPGLVCKICNEKIQTIASAISVDDGYVHFDCALEQVKAEEKPNENQTVSYIGSGKFGVCEKDENGKWTIVKTIQYESAEKNKAMKEFVEGLKI